MSVISLETIKEKVSLKNSSTWRVGGEAKYYCQPQNQTELQEAYLWAHNNKISVTLLGGGSNVLISDKGISGLVICTKDFNLIEGKHVLNNVFYITAQAGAKKADLLKVFLKENLAPALFLAGLPGDVAGGVVMNAGVAEDILPKEFVDVVHSFEVLKFTDGDLKPKLFNKTDVDWDYRHSKGWQPGIITRVTLAWPMNADPLLKEKVKEANQVRLKKQPLKQPSCGSTFRNPSKEQSAGMLIDKAGLKGFKIGGAQVSEKHANFIVTEEGATANDVNSVMEHVKKVVLEKFQIQLQSEVVKLGDW